MESLFSFGVLVAAPSVMKRISELNIDIACLKERHLTGDWSDMCEKDQIANKEAIKNGAHIFASYSVHNSVPFTSKTEIWFITAADRSSTTVLFPME